MDDFPPYAAMALIAVVPVQIAYLATLARCLRHVSPWNRVMEPSQVWWNLVPGFDIYWRFVTIRSVYKSLRKEFKERRVERSKDDYGRKIGFAYCAWVTLFGIVAAARVIESEMGLSPIPELHLRPIFFAAFVVCWLIYWWKVTGYARRLLETDAGRQYGLEH